MCAIYPSQESVSEILDNPAAKWDADRPVLRLISVLIGRQELGIEPVLHPLLPQVTRHLSRNSPRNSFRTIQSDKAQACEASPVPS